MHLIRQAPGRGPRRMRGLSLVELMVGIAIGMIVVAGATLMLGGLLSDNRRLITEAQVQQDLRATTDIITRELRRAGAWSEEAEALRLAWIEGNLLDAAHNHFAATLTPASGSADDTVDFSYHPTGPNREGPFGYRLNTGTGAIETRIRAGGWQDLTDRNTMEVTAFSVDRIDDSWQTIPCPRACADGTTNCWPRVYVRALEVSITARSRQFPEIERTFRSRVRLRNNYVQFAVIPPSPGVSLMCPT